MTESSAIRVESPSAIKTGRVFDKVVFEGDDERTYQRLAQQIAEIISRGELRTGDRLPSERLLSERFKVSRTSLREAIIALEIRGIVETQQGTGTFVATRRAERKPSERKKALEGLVDRFVALAASSGFSLDELAEILVERAEKSDRR